MSNDEDYQKECMFCHKKILMSKRSKNWLPYELDNGPHKCKSKQEDDAKVNGAIDKIEKENQRTTLTIAEIIKRLKSIGIEIDWEVFLKGTDPK